MCKAAVKSSPPTNQNSAFYRPDAFPLENQFNGVTALLRDDVSHSTDLQDAGRTIVRVILQFISFMTTSELRIIWVSKANRTRARNYGFDFHLQ